jgi:fumarate reductase subunit D
MLTKLLTPLTTATAGGVALRYATSIVASIIALLGVLGLLTPDQVESLTRLVPELFAAVAALVAVVIPLYATLTKSRPDNK